MLERLELESLTPASLWSELDADTRLLAAEALYRGQRQDLAGRQEADRAIAAAVRFREVAVRQLPAAKRIDYLLRAVRPDDSLASTLLLALHLDRRVPVLEAFLDRLGIPQRGGMIDDEHELRPPPAERLAAAVDALYESFPAPEVDVYLATLCAMDLESWAELPGVLRRRARD